MTAASSRSRAGAQTKADAKPEKKETVQQLKNRLRNEAEREVLDLHKKEVIERTQEKYTAHGLKYVRRLSDEEKAAKAIEDNLKKYPNLRQQFIATDPNAEVVRVQSGKFTGEAQEGIDSAQ